MPIIRPYHRNYRGIKESFNSGYSNWAYIIHKDYAKEPYLYTRAFLNLQEEIQNLFQYIEPADVNLSTYSYRIQELFIRICIEVEANFKAIFRENIYSKDSKKWNITDYYKINKTHHLSSYEITFPIWNGYRNVFRPFEVWSKDYEKLDWYDAYNKCKHDKYANRSLANFKNLLNAFAGLCMLLSSQFCTMNFSTGDTVLTEGNVEGYFTGEFAIGGYLLIKFPSDWKDEELYDFNWSDLKNETDIFQKIDYDKI